YGISNYKKSSEQKAVFQDVEITLINLYPTYRHYATYGFRILFLPAPLSILFTNSTTFQNITANIESGYRLNIYQSAKGKSLFETNKYLFSDFSGIFLFFFSLISLLYGYITFFHKDFQRELASLADETKLFLSTLLSRAFLLCLCAFFFLVAALLLLAINGISIGINRDLFMFFISMCRVSLFFFVIGSLFSALKSYIKGLVYSIATWFVFVFIVPFLVSMVVSYNSNTIKQEYQLELEKLKMMMDFEKNARENKVTLNINEEAGDIHRQYMESYYKNEFPKMQKLEEEVKTQMQDLSKLHFALSALFPTTSYLAFTNEISSKGYKNLDLFYQEVQKIKEDFFKESMAKVYFSPQPAKVEPFLKGDQNIFVGKPTFPDYFALSILIDLLYIAGLLMLTYYSYSKFMFSLPKKAEAVEESKEIQIESGDIISYEVYSDLLNRQLYDLMSNKNEELTKQGYSCKIYLDDQLLNEATQRQEFLYTTNISEIPGYVKVKDYSTLLMDLMEVDKTKREEIKTRFSLDTMKNKKISDLDLIEKSKLSLSILAMKPFDVYILNNINKGLYEEHCITLTELLSDLQKNGKAIVFLAQDLGIIRKGRKGMEFCKSDVVIKYIKNIADESKSNTEC
ncbi:MAG: hypothetical protein MUF15_24765, partial [Acidobacteria bacterium]|nr:hypothetical protein [Acidobacteriota bacterium]